MSTSAMTAEMKELTEEAAKLIAIRNDPLCWRDSTAQLADLAPQLLAEVTRLTKELADARAALEKIAKAEPEPFTGFPVDWKEQIAACPECQGWAKNHPIQNGICDLHRQPIWARERHDKHEEVAMRHRHERVAREALSTLTASEKPKEQ